MSASADALIPEGLTALLGTEIALSTYVVKRHHVHSRRNNVALARLLAKCLYEHRDQVRRYLDQAERRAALVAPPRSRS